MQRRAIWFPLGSAFLALVVGCAQPGGVRGTTPSCEELETTTLSGMPLDTREIVGAPSEVSDMYGEVRSLASGATILTAVERAGDDTLLVTIPLHPDLSADGGEAELMVHSDGGSCPAIALSIDPLPSAEGAFLESMNMLDTRLRDALVSEGHAVDDYYAIDVSSLPDHLLPYATVHSLLAHPADPESVLAVARGLTQTIDGVEVDLRLLDGITARVGLLDLATDMPILLPQPSASPTALSPAQDGESATCPDDDFGLAPVSDTSDLSSRMRRQSESAAYLNGAAGRVQEDIAMITGMAATSKDPVAGPLAKTTTAVLTKSLTMHEIAQNIFPNDLETTLVLSPDTFHEDDPGPGTWRLLAFATSDPWNLNKEVLEFALEKGLADASVGKQLFAGKTRDHPGFDAVASEVDEYVIKEPTSEALSRLMGAIGADQDDAGFHVPAGCWDGDNDQGFDLSDEAWTDVSVTGDAIYVVDFNDHGEYFPQEPGVATLEVSTDSQAFGNQVFIKTGTVEVLMIDVLVNPQSRVVEPGDLVTFTAQVSNADDQSVTWHTTAGHFDVTTTSADGNNEAILITPADEASYPVTVTARSSSKGGIRGNADAPVREGEGKAVLDAQPFAITPDPLCLEPGDPWTFRAVTELGDAAEVTWSAARGTFDAPGSGAYTAPSEGTDTITATSVEDPDTTASLDIDVGDCHCTFELDLSNGVVGSTDGAAAFVLENGGVEIELDGYLVAGTAGDPILAGVFTPSWSGAADSYDITEASAAKFAPPQPTTALYFQGDVTADCPGCGGTLVIETVDADLLRGHYVVTMVTVGEDPKNPPPPTIARASFIAARHEPGSVTDPYSTCISKAWE